MAEPIEISKALEMIFAFLERPGESQSSIARRCNLTAGVVSRICARIRTVPDFHTARKFRDGIGVPFDAWFEPATKPFQKKLLAAAA